MSLVAYGSSDESSDEDEAASESVSHIESALVKKTRTVLSLPAPKDAVDTITSSESSVENTEHMIPTTDEPALFKNLPKPKQIEISPTDEVEDDMIPPKKDTKVLQGKSLRKNRTPVKISLPSLSEFKDVDEEQEERKRNRIKPSEKGTGLFSILPPPKGSATKATIKSLIPDVVKRAPQISNPIQPRQVRVMPVKSGSTINKKIPLTSINYDSDSDDESSGASDAKLKVEGKMDFFSLANSSKASQIAENSDKDFFSLSEEPQITSAKSSSTSNRSTSEMYQNKRGETSSQAFEITDQKVRGDGEKPGFIATTMEYEVGREGVEILDKTLTSNVMNLPKEEIIMKNKAEVGPKLPVPEQEYNVDSQGNVAFDEKAIEYLCGKRGVKRKNKDFDEANIIEINGEDIKPDEREWLVKALTEEAAERPVSMESAGPSTQSRKKHQITYLAHQAKAMEVELKNQWAQNRVTRKQTQSKYGF